MVWVCVCVCVCGGGGGEDGSPGVPVAKFVVVIQKPFTVCGKQQENASQILITLTSRSDSDFESSNVSLKENKTDGVNPNSNDIDYYVRKNERKIQWFSADFLL